MVIRTLCSLSGALAALFLASGSAAAQKGPALPDVLKLATDYLAQYAERLGAVAADEEYMQYETSTGRMSTPKRINAHVVWLGVSEGAVESFRDVVGIDSVPVRPKDERLFDLFKTPRDASRPQAEEMTDNSVRQYIDGNLHLLDQAMLAVEFLRAANQEHSTFKLEGVKTMNGAQVAVLKFNEKAQPRLVPSPENAAAVGRFWIEMATGTVRQTELGLTARRFNVHTVVKYAADGATSLWLPVEMTQQCQVSGGMSSVVGGMGTGGGNSVRQELEGRAIYTRYRRVPVDLTKLK
jgi:hypothetical protein